MVQIPKHIKTALKLLAGDYPQNVLKQLLLQVLQNLEDTGNECVQLANTTGHEFSQVMLLLGEVIEVTTTTQSLHEEQIRKNKKEMTVLRTIEDGMKKEEEFRLKRYQDATESVKKAEDSYYQALREIPTGWNAILQNFVGGMLNMMPTIVGGITGGPVGALVGSTMTKPIDSGHGLDTPSSSSSQNASQQVLSVGHSQTLVMANQFSNSLQSFIEDVSTTNYNNTLFKGYATVFKTFRKFITTLSDNPAKGTALNLIKRAENLIAKELTKGNQKKKLTEPNHAFIEQLKDIAEQLKPLQTAAQLSDPKTAGQSLSNIGSQTASSSGGSPKGELFKAQLAQVNLVDMKRFQDEQAASYLALLGEMRKLSSQMVSINFTTIQYKEIVAMLEKALNLLGRLRVQWNEFVLFFTDMSIKIKNMIQGPLRRFLQISRTGSDTAGAIRMQLISMLKDDTYGIHHEAYVLFVMSRTYYDVSSQHLMGRLAGLSQMLTAKTDEDRTNLMKSIEKDTNSTLAQVEAMIRERKQAFDEELDKKNNELNALITQLGGLDEKNNVAIKQGKKLISAKNDDEWGDD
ncbi:unnamed protein product [Rotaria sp. Silwood1]|nr:unnamed protein product [Rotaria sp. Silwood1]CAF4979192.1 unnamed protein product [Rotaria sp. Silwood1]